jgi:hypothetical protein
MLKIDKGCTVNTVKCPFSTWNKGCGHGLEMKPCCIKHLREIIFYLSDLFKELEITYWMDFGTLLGAVRNNRTIPHDTDGDFCLFLKDRLEIIELSSRISNDGFHIGPTNDRGDGHIKIYRSSKNHMAVDLFFWHLNKSTGILSSGGLNAPKSFPIWWVEKLSQVLIFDKPIMAPREPKQFLKFRFGKDWRNPQNKKNHFIRASFTHRFAFEYAKKNGWKCSPNFIKNTIPKKVV